MNTTPSPDAAYHYPGEELDVFAHARNWKAYLATLIRPYLDGEVIEVGAGIGSVTAALCDSRVSRWLCLEPDEGLARRLAARIDAGELPAACAVSAGRLADLSDAPIADAILYVDVLEHIADDAAETRAAARRLRPGGRLIVMSPAHPWLFSALDVAVGHCRRYVAGDARRLTPPGLTMRRLDYLDSVGMAASLANRLVLRKAAPSPSEVALWDGVMVPLSRWIDPLFARRLGKSILMVWQKPFAQAPA